MTDAFVLCHDSLKPLCFVTTGALSRSVHAALSGSRSSILKTFEEVKEFELFDQYQYICLTSDVVLKKKVIEFLEDRGCNFFSVVHKTSDLSYTIGHGTFINAFNQGMSADLSGIGNHCVIGTHSLLGHNCIIDDFCHVSSFAYLSECHLQQGCCLGIRVSIFDDRRSQQVRKIPEFTNIIAGSMITKPIVQAGTYFGNRRLNQETSLDRRIV